MSGAIASTDSFSQGAVNQTLHNLLVTLYGSWIQNDIDTEYVRYGFDWGVSPGITLSGPFFTADTSFGFLTNESYQNRQFSYSYQLGSTNTGYGTETLLVADTTYAFRAHLKRFQQGPFGGGFITDVYGAILYSKTDAVTATNTAAGTATSITSSGALITFSNFKANTVESTGSCFIEYRKLLDIAWTTAGAIIPGIFGYGAQSMNRTLTGLLGSTTYEYRLHITRNTNNETDFTTTPQTFVTTAAAPSVTTGAASSIGATAATLNGTLVTNGFAATALSFDYGLTTGYGSSATATPSSSSSDTVFSANITGLTANTTYHFRAKAVWSGGTVLGSDVTFITAQTPDSLAANEDHVTIFDFDAVYGVSKAFVFTAASPALTSSDKFLNAAAPWANTECIILLDGVLSTIVNADGRSTNAPTRIGSTGYYTLTLTAAEMSAENIFIFISDTGNAARDVLLHIRTKIQTGQFAATATAIGGNAAGMILTGVGTSGGLTAVGGTSARGDIDGVLGGHIMRRQTLPAQGGTTATQLKIDASAAGTNGYYTGCVVYIYSGTGTDQFRIVTDYTAATQLLTLHRAWTTQPTAGALYVLIPGNDLFSGAPTAELASMPATTAAYGLMIQFLFQRFAFKRTQDASNQRMFNSTGAGATQIAIATVNDSAGLQTIGQMA